MYPFLIADEARNIFPVLFSFFTSTWIELWGIISLICDSVARLSISSSRTSVSRSLFISIIQSRILFNSHPGFFFFLPLRIPLIFPVALQVKVLITSSHLVLYNHFNWSSLTHWGRVTQLCVFTLQLCKTDDANLRFFNTRFFSLHNTLNYAIQRACLRMVLLTDVYRNLTSLWINL